MHNPSAKNIVIEEKDVVVPDAYRALALGLDPQVWADAQMLAPLLDGADLEKAIRLMEMVHGLGYLLLMGASELEAIGLSAAERARVAVLNPWA